MVLDKNPGWDGDLLRSQLTWGPKPCKRALWDLVGVGEAKQIVQRSHTETSIGRYSGRGSVLPQQSPPQVPPARHGSPGLSTTQPPDLWRLTLCSLPPHSLKGAKISFSFLKVHPVRYLVIVTNTAVRLTLHAIPLLLHSWPCLLAS